MMSYRRKTETVDELRRYKALCRDNLKLIERIGLPSLVVDNYNAFVYLLTHGALWPHAPLRFDVNALDEEQRKGYMVLLDKYFEAGFMDPSVSDLTKAELDELERKHPKQFEGRATLRKRRDEF